ncbi:hypothetical protein FHS21_001316 [Phyllobacterium trifolii]|uniref:Uncharacterized protein n=1 Tax=Phyllobacterium trifolii TaxID=300193 RepID=A0A839U4G9_9HYPH|nr:DUF6362 family protein [Phyllobacterium trifolii]MBB3144915.1 hypothetical protein [Phyllobacterium trifolii]
MNEGDIAERLIEAYEIARNSSDQVGPKRLKAQAMPYLHSQADKNGWGSERLAEERKDFWESLSRTPTARQISEAEEAISWLALVKNEAERRCLSEWAYCMASKQFFKDVCFRMGIHPETGRRRKNRAIVSILFALGGNVLLHNKSCGNSLLHEEPETDYFADTITDPRQSNGITSWADDEAFQPFIAGAKHDFSWADKRNEQRRQRRAATLKKQAA